MEPRDLVQQSIGYIQTVDPKDNPFDEMNASVVKKFCHIKEFPEVITIIISVAANTFPLYGSNDDLDDDTSVSKVGNDTPQDNSVENTSRTKKNSSADKGANAREVVKDADTRTDEVTAEHNQRKGDKKKKPEKWVPTEIVKHRLKNLDQIVTISNRPLGKSNKNQKYQTCGLVLHQTSEEPGLGHYVCYLKTRARLKKNEKWVFFDDQTREEQKSHKDINYDKGSLVAVMMRKYHSRR